MKHTVTVQYLEFYVPPRCRNKRLRSASLRTTLKLLTLTDEHDPVAAEIQHFASDSDRANPEVTRTVPYRRSQDSRWWTRPEPGHDGHVRTVLQAVTAAGLLTNTDVYSQEHAAVLAQLNLNDQAEDQSGQLWVYVPSEPHYTTEVRQGWSQVKTSHWGGAHPGERTVGATETDEEGLTGFDLALKRARSEQESVYSRIVVLRPDVFTHHVPAKRTVRVQLKLDVTLTLPGARSAEDAKTQLTGQLGTLLGADAAVSALNAAVNLDVREVDPKETP